MGGFVRLGYSALGWALCGWFVLCFVLAWLDSLAR